MASQPDLPPVLYDLVRPRRGNRRHRPATSRRAEPQTKGGRPVSLGMSRQRSRGDLKRNTRGGVTRPEPSATLALARPMVGPRPPPPPARMVPDRLEDRLSH